MQKSHSTVKDQRPVRAEAPSNIALIKYWGKLDPTINWPANDSLSMTLSKAQTITTVHANDSNQSHGDQVYFEGRRQPEQDPFARRVCKHLDRLRQATGFPEAPPLTVDTVNTFPLSCGLASSASGMAALTLAALAYWLEIQEMSDFEGLGFDRQRLAGLARLGSGSACRSLWGGFVQWHHGTTPDQQSLELIRGDENQELPKLADIIVMVSKEPKNTGSSQAHLGAWESPLFKPRLTVIDDRLKRIKKALVANHFNDLAYYAEEEALELHAVAMTSVPPVTYLSQDSLNLCQFIRKERYLNDFPAFFTIDAGPNIHVLCPLDRCDFVKERLKHHFPHFDLFIDHIGVGPKLYRLD